MELPTDTTGVHALWRLIEGLSKSTDGVSPTSGNGYEVALKALIVLLALLVLAIVVLSGVILWGIIQSRKDQKAGIKALSTSKDTTKREIVAILQTQLASANAATVAANDKLADSIDKLGKSYNLINLDLVVIANKLKIPLMSLPSKSQNTPPQEGG